MTELFCTICGMKINSTNFDFNKEAFEDKNSINNIKFCPFCGSPLEYIKNEDESYKYRNIKLKDDALKIIDHAMKLEVFNGDFYKKAAFLAKNENIKDMFKSLSNIEYMHARIHNRIGGFKKLPVLRDMDYSKYNTDNILLDMACKREKHAVEYYEKYIDYIDSYDIKTIFKVLSEVEKGHIELTSR
ncbi:metal-iron-binding protein [Clostridium fermenticellae]|uniref:Metal-iron-binding protein n=1 Tax=Clostridium fermenticellae TaxID=2068654 RepID=A0A386H3H0_9CLOT|nr:ferritin family protein [Clostridium fermenticellae]AYD40267.1 metal-iron-binding protein [Clostridium fermenticellae]